MRLACQYSWCKSALWALLRDLSCPPRGILVSFGSLMEFNLPLAHFKGSQTIAVAEMALGSHCLPSGKELYEHYWKLLWLNYQK